jgi:phosphoribosylanthranilate isomerase
MKIKVCGVPRASAEHDIALLSMSGIDAVGLWHGVPGAAADMARPELARFARFARAVGVEPVIVTFESDVRALGRAVGESGVRWLQLHAYQLPRVVHDLKARVGVKVVKVLHIRGERCVDRRLIGAYERAGVDAFLLDAMSSDGRVGSTGESIRPDVAVDVVAQLNRPFYLAGGLSATGLEAYASLTRHPGFAGIDVSTAARDATGRLRTARLEAIDQAWRGAHVH